MATLPYCAGWHTSGSGFHGVSYRHTAHVGAMAVGLRQCRSFRKMTPAQRAREVCTGIDAYTSWIATSASTHARRPRYARCWIAVIACMNPAARSRPARRQRLSARPAPATAATRGAAKSRTANTSASAGIFRCRSTAHWKKKLAEHDAQARPRHRKNQLYQRCYAQVLPMSAEQAYDYYKQH